MGGAPTLASTGVVGRRLGAAALDAALIGVIVAGVYFAGATTADTGGDALACADLQASGGASNCVPIGDTLYYYEGAAAVRFWVVGVAVLLTFLAIIPALLGGSLGKMVAGIRVVDRFGSPAGFGRHIGRWLLLAVDWFPYCFPIVGVATLAASKTNQRLGDRAAGTFVVGASEVGRPVLQVPIATPSMWAAPTTAAPTAATPWAPPGLAPSQPPPTWGTAPPGAAAMADPPAPGSPPSGTVQWDERWNAWLYWDPTSRRWLRHDPATNQWIPI